MAQKLKLKSWGWYVLYTVVAFILLKVLESIVTNVIGDPIAKVITSPILYIVHYSDQNTISWQLSISIMSILYCLFVILVIFLLIHRVLVWMDARKRKRIAAQTDDLKHMLQNLVNEFDIISSAHLYKYRITCTKCTEVITMEHLVSAVDSTVNINTIIQHIYKIRKDYYDMITKFAQEYNKDLLTDKRNGSNPSISGKARSLSDSLKNKISGLDKSTITEEDCCLYRCFRSIADRVDPNNPVNYYLSDNIDLEDALLKKMRTGMLPGIFFDDIQWFRNTTSVFKKQRLYVVIKAKCCGDKPKYNNQLLLLTVEGMEDITDCKTIAANVCRLQNEVTSFLARCLI